MRGLGLEGKRGLVPGFSGENSAAFHIARTLTGEGAQVALTSRPEKPGELAPAAEAAGAALHLGADAQREESLRAAVDAIGNAWGALDFIVHTFVHVPRATLAAPLTELGASDFHTVLDISVLSLTRICGFAKPLLSASESARVVALTSESSHLATPNYHVAGIAKAALETATRYLALELGRDGVLCNLLSFSAMDSAGATNTIGEKNISRTREHLAKRSMTGAACRWQDVADAAAWLCSPRMSNMTGQTVVVDGGYTASYF